MHPTRTIRPAAAPLAALVALLACAGPPRVEVDRLAGAELAAGQTFALDPDRVESDDPAYGPSARAAARDALVAGLTARGLEPVDDPESADLLVAVGVSSRVHAEGGGVFVEPGHPQVVRRRSGLRTPVGDVPIREERHVVHHAGRIGTQPAVERRERTVVVDVFEAGSKRLLWRGSSRQKRSRERIDLDDLRERVGAIAAEFPSDPDA